MTVVKDECRESLLPCPFCGGEAGRYEDVVERLRPSKTGCRKCGVWISGWAGMREPQAEAWNTRAALGAKPEATQGEEFTLLRVIADIRQKTGVGDKPMLSELADTLAALIPTKPIDHP